MSAAEKLDSLIPCLDREVRGEIEHLRQLAQWAYDQQPFVVGDEVVIKTAPPIGRSSGWWTCREFLVEGSTGVITDVHFYNDRWGVIFTPDVQWDASDTYGRKISDRPSSFYFDPARLRSRKKKDQPLTVPKGATPWRSAS